MKRSIWAIIAAKDEEKHIGKVVQETKKYVNKVLVVDDGSSDKTRDVAQKNGAIVLSHIVNLGKGSATNTGCEYAIDHKATHLVLIDADGQHLPRDIPKFIERLRNNDIVFGVRTARKSMPFILKFGNNAISKIAKILYGVKVNDTQCGFRAMSKKTYQKIKWRSPRYSMESEMIAKVGKKRLKYTCLPINTIYSDKYKGTTLMDGVKIVTDMFWWKVSR